MPKRPTVKTQSPKKTTRKKTGTIADKIESIHFQDDDPITLAIYGRSGTGKTRLWSTFPGPILALLCGGTNSGELRSIDTPENRKKISSIQIEDVDEIRQAAEHVESTGKYKTLVLDHASALEDMILANILGLEKLPEQKKWGMATIKQYGQRSLQFKTVIRTLLNLVKPNRINLVIVAQERDFTPETEEEDDLQMSRAISLGLGEKTVEWLNPEVDYIVQCLTRQKVETTTTKVGKEEITTETETDEVEFCARTGPHAVYASKFRVPPSVVLPNMVVNPTYEKLHKLIRGVK